MTIPIIKNSFVGGEWSPSLYSRTDLKEHGSAVKKMENFFPHPHGPASNRPGLRFVGELKDQSKTAVLIPFQFSITQSYMLEFGDQYMRVYKDQARVVEASVAISGASKANPCQITATSHGFVNGDWVVITSVGGMTQLNGRTFIVANATTHTFTLQTPQGTAVISTGYTTYTSGGVATKVYTVSTPYIEADLADLDYVQSEDVLYITHPSYAVRKLSRTGHTSWTLSTVTFAPSISAPTNLARSAGSGTGKNIVVTAVSNTNEESRISNVLAGVGSGDTLTWTAATGAVSYKVYEELNSDGVYCYLSAAVSTTCVLPGTTSDEELNPPTAQSVFNTGSDYPSVCTFFDQRFIVAATDNKPQTIFGSVVGSYENYDRAVPLIKDDDAFEFTLASATVDAIKWLAPVNDLLVGTAGAVWKMAPGEGDVISPTSVKLRMQSQVGTAPLKPIIVNNAVVFVDNSRSIIHHLAYSLDVDAYIPDDLTLLARHLFEGYQITSWAFQRYPDSIIWAVRDDGTAVGMTYIREQKIWGWHRHTTQGYFERVSTVTNIDGSSDTYFIVRRKVSGTTRRYIELLTERLPRNSVYERDIRDSFFVDSGLSYDNPVAISGATKSSPTVITTSEAHGFSDGDHIDIAEVLGMTELNDKRYVVDNATPYTFMLKTQAGVDVDSTAYTGYAGSSGYAWKAATSITGLHHLEGESVSVVADGSVITGHTVSGGSVTLANKASRVHVGLGYTQDLDLLDFEQVTQTGTIQDKRRTIKSVVLELENTRGLFIGPDEDRLVEVQFRNTENYDDPTEMFNGEKEVLIKANESRKSGLLIRNTYPLPITVLSVIARIKYGEK